MTRARLPRSLSATRALAEGARSSWRRTLVHQQIEDLNTSFDRLAGRQRGKADTLREVTALAQRIVRAAQLVRSTAIQAAWAFVEEELDRPEDAFGAAILLLGLDGEDAKVRAWASALPGKVVRTLRQLAVLP